MDKKQQEPYKHLGDRLRTIRQKLHESVSEVSGAVEIDDKVLERIEQGRERPSEDILLLLINHFGIRDEEAASLWQLAGYEQPRNEEDVKEEMNAGGRNASAVLIMAIDPRIIYSDGIQVTASNRGVVMNFSQASGTPQSLTTARIGMSRDQAYAVIQTLQDALSRSEPRQLPEGQTASDIDKSSNGNEADQIA